MVNIMISEEQLARLVNKMLYISGISSRNKDSKSWRGVEEKDGKFILDIKEQTRGRANHNGTAVIENIQNILNDLPLSVVPKIDKFLKEQPELYLTLTLEDNEKEVTGLLNFFIYR